MGSLEVFLNCSKLTLKGNALLHRILKDSEYLKVKKKLLSTTFYLSQSKQTTTLPLNRSSPNIHQYESPKISPLLCFKRSTSNKDQDIPLCYSELQKLMKSGNTVLIDVRSEDETWRTGVIPGSLCVPLPQLESALTMSPEQFLETYCRKKPNTDDHIIFICRRGERSYKAAKKARKMGYENVNSYQDGFIAWFDKKRISREIRRLGKEYDIKNEEK